MLLTIRLTWNPRVVAECASVTEPRGKQPVLVALAACGVRPSQASRLAASVTVIRRRTSIQRVRSAEVATPASVRKRQRRPSGLRPTARCRARLLGRLVHRQRRDLSAADLEQVREADFQLVALHPPDAARRRDHPGSRVLDLEELVTEVGVVLAPVLESVTGPLDDDPGAFACDCVGSPGAEIDPRVRLVELLEIGLEPVDVARRHQPDPAPHRPLDELRVGLPLHRVRHHTSVALPFWLSDAVLITTQASLIALPAARHPAWMERLRGAAWALVPVASICIVVGVIALAPGAADVLTYMALIATPLAAGLSLGYIIHGARPPLALLAIPLLAIAWAAKGNLAGDTASTALTALGCLGLGWLLAAVAPTNWLKLGIVAMAVVDSILVFSNALDQPNATLNAAAPAGGLPQLQFVNFGSAVMGYGDLFIAGVLGGVLVVERARQLPVAVACLVFAALFDLLFFVTDSLPATVPVALALLGQVATSRRRTTSRT